MEELPIYADITLSTEEMTAIMSCIELLQDELREKVEEISNVKLEGIRSKLGEAIKSNIEFYEEFVNEEST